MIVKMGKGESRVECKLEIQGGAGDRVFDVRTSFSFEGDDGLEIKSKSGLTLLAEKPMILQSYREGEKWRALVMTVKREVLE